MNDEIIEIISLLGLLVMIAALGGLYAVHSLISPNPIAISVQGIAVALIVWARLTFGFRSFHATANPTAGGLIRTGPYRYIRHPIYTAACLLGWAGVVAHLSFPGVGLGVLLLFGGLGRMLCEERLVKRTYPEYNEYAKTTKRMIPYVF